MLGARITTSRERIFTWGFGEILILVRMLLSTIGDGTQSGFSSIIGGIIVDMALNMGIPTIF
jgi:hypothetical protein